VQRNEAFHRWYPDFPSKTEARRMTRPLLGTPAQIPADVILAPGSQSGYLTGEAFTRPRVSVIDILCRRFQAEISLVQEKALPNGRSVRGGVVGMLILFKRPEFGDRTK
jgi:hypothetical protein